MLALCFMPSSPYYAYNYAGILNSSLTTSECLLTVLKILKCCIVEELENVVQSGDEQPHD